MCGRKALGCLLAHGVLTHHDVYFHYEPELGFPPPNTISSTGRLEGVGFRGRSTMPTAIKGCRRQQAGRVVTRRRELAAQWWRGREERAACPPTRLRGELTAQPGTTDFCLNIVSYKC